MSGARIRDPIFVATCVLFTAGLATPGLALLLVVAAAEVARRVWRWVPTSLDRPLAALGGAALLSAAFSEWRMESLRLSLLLIAAMTVSVWATAAYAAGDLRRSLRLLAWWVAGGVAAGLWVAANFDPTRQVLASLPWLGSNAVGTTLAVAVVMATGLLSGRRPRTRWLLVAGLPVMVVGLVATWSRGAWLGAGAGLLTLMVLGLRVDRRLVVAALALVAVLGLIAPTRWPELWAEVQSLASLEANRGRIVIWTTTPRMIADHPVVGTGFGTFVTAYQRYRPPDAPDPEPPFAHNLFLNSAAEMGVVGLLAMVALCVAGLRAAVRWVRRCPRGSAARTVAVTVLSALVALLANQMVDGTVMSVHVGFGFFALLALAAVGERGLMEARAADAARMVPRARATPSAPAR